MLRWFRRTPPSDPWSWLDGDTVAAPVRSFVPCVACGRRVLLVDSRCPHCGGAR